MKSHSKKFSASYISQINMLPQKEKTHFLNNLVYVILIRVELHLHEARLFFEKIQK